ncbi:hypothetical protein NCAS_0A07770 [Naumovozyma castellii]|uniref:Uncharacterized protein n=1 Tax=Naumovozyma castellii TaxID=27288 RepID=G0V787_NAUCA|nr:hypothetical protein NCAS_0A07770 [Naumovozyma castellii CBS 4309]CCC67335.1 hypothetical protein NCAS_0A07770 [Naumovozyma castellii CBS 4309]
MSKYSPYNNTYISGIFSRVLKYTDNRREAPIAKHNATLEKISELQEIFGKLNDAIAQKRPRRYYNIVETISKRTGHYLVGKMKSESSLIPFVFFIIIATSTIILGCFMSVQSIPATALPPTDQHSLFDQTDLTIDQEHEIMVVKEKNGKKEVLPLKEKKEKDSDLLEISEKYIIIIPVFCTFGLLSLYFLLSQTNLSFLLDRFLQFFHVVAGLSSTTTGVQVCSYVISSIIRNVCHWTHTKSSKILPTYRLTLSKSDKNFSRTVLVKDEVGGIKFSWVTILSTVCSCLLTVAFYLYPTNWLVTNLVGINLALNHIITIQLKNLRTGVFILIALFLYDIFFVFGSNIMLTVATQIKLPAKVSLPIYFDTAQNDFEYAFLGLGDIALPAVFISLCYKFDIWKWHYDHPRSEFHLLRWCYVGKYFITAMVSYVSALLTCLVFLVKSGRAQPALLYIVPYLLTSIIGLAWYEGELKQFWTFRYNVIEIDAEKGQISPDTGNLYYSGLGDGIEYLGEHFIVDEALDYDDDDADEAFDDEGDDDDFEKDMNIGTGTTFMEELQLAVDEGNDFDDPDFIYRSGDDA